MPLIRGYFMYLKSVRSLIVQMSCPLSILPAYQDISGLNQRATYKMEFFRKRLWAGGNFGMAQTLFSNVECWLRHMALDQKTGRDPKGIHLRAATGLEAVDYFVPGYAVWAKLIEALADLGYDSNFLVSKLFSQFPLYICFVILMT